MQAEIDVPTLDFVALAACWTLVYAFAFLALLALKDILVTRTSFGIRVTLLHFLFGSTAGMASTGLVTLPTGAVSALLLRWAAFGRLGRRDPNEM